MNENAETSSATADVLLSNQFTHKLCDPMGTININTSITTPNWAEKLIEVGYAEYKGTIPLRLIPDRYYPFFTEMAQKHTIQKGLVCISMYEFRTLVRAWQEQHTCHE